MSLLSRLFGPLLDEVIDRRARVLVAEHLAEASHVPPNDMLMHRLVYGDRRKLHIHPTAEVNNALFNLSSGEITVGEYAFFGHSVAVLTGTHDITKFDRERQVGVPKSGRDVVIGRGVWVSSNAVVLGPCRIGEHAVVAAASVVTGDVPPYTVVAGIPAKPVKQIPRPEDAASSPPDLGEDQPRPAQPGQVQ